MAAMTLRCTSAMCPKRPSCPILFGRRSSDASISSGRIVPNISAADRIPMA
jgi:hypothetical protein